MVEVSDRVQRAWCDWDHDSERSLSTDDAELENLSPTWCRHGYAKPWKSGESEWGLESWLTLLAFVADRDDGGTYAGFEYHNGGDKDPYYYAEVWIGSEDYCFNALSDEIESPTEAVIRAIDTILDHAQEGDDDSD